MKGLRGLRFLLAFTIAVGLALLALRGEALRARAETAVKALIERHGSARLGAPLHLDGLHLRLWPPAVRASGLGLGERGAVARADAVRLRLLVGASLREWRPVVEARVEHPEADLPALLRALPAPAEEMPIALPFRLQLTARAPRARLCDQPPVQLGAGDWLQVDVSADALSRRPTVAASAAHLVFDVAGRAAAIDGFSLRLDDSEVGWRLRGLTVAGPGLRLDTTEQGGALQARATIELGELAWLGEAASLSGTAALDATLAGVLQAPTVRGVLTVPNLALADQPLGEARVEFVADRRQAAITAGRLQAGGAVAEFEATLQLDETLGYEAQIHLAEVSLSALPVPDAIAASGLVGHGVLKWSGTLAPLRVTLDGDGGFASRNRSVSLTWRAGARYAAAASTLHVELAQGAANRARGEWSLGDDGALQGQVTLHLADVGALSALGPVEAAPPLYAEIDAAVRFTGTLADPQLDGQLGVRELRWRDVALARLAAQVNGDRHVLRSARVEADIGGGTLVADGAIALEASAENHWRLRVEKLDGDWLMALLQAVVGTRPPLAGGTLRLDTVANGPWARLRLDGTARIEDLVVAGEPVARVHAAVRVDGDRWALDAAAHNRTRQRFAINASGRGAADLVIDLRSDGWTLSSASRDEWPRLGGTWQVNATLRGPAGELDGHVAASADDLVVFGQFLGAPSLWADARGGAWSGTAVLLGGALSVNGQVRREPGRPFVMDAVWREAMLPSPPSARPELRIASTGALRVDGRLTDPRDSAVSLTMSALTISHGPLTLALGQPLVGACAKRRCRLERVALRAGDSTLVIAGEGGFDGFGRIELEGGGSLELLELIGDPIESAGGRFSIDVAVSRRATGWEARGQASIADLTLDVGLPVTMSRTNGRLIFDGDALRIESFSGRLNSGRFAVAGLIDWRTGPALAWELSDVGMEPLSRLELEMSGHGSLDGGWRTPRVAGEVRIARLLYDRDVKLTDLLPDFDRALAAAPRPPGSRDVALAVHVIAPGELYVENNLARLEGRVDVRIAGTATRPVLAGRVEALDGEVYVRSRTFELTGATVDFRPDLGLVAALNVSAESLINTPEAAYTVAVQVTGTTADPRVTLSSDDPTLSPTDIATLIAVGKTTSQLRATGGLSISDALGVVPAQVADLVEGPARRLLPVDRLEFEPSFSRTSGTFEPQLKIGKDLTESLSASVGQTFGVASRTRVQVDYRLGPRVTLPFGWESQTEKEAGAFSGGIELRYEFWRLTPFTLRSGLW